MKSYEYHRPTSLGEAFELAGAVPQAKFIAGGTDLLVQMRKRHRPTPSALISLRGVDELARIEVGERMRIGAAAPLTDVAAHPVIAERFPALIAAIAVVGSRQIRNVATLGGNLCNASPAADTAPPLLVYDAHVELRSNEGTRELPLSGFFAGPGASALREGEILTAVLLDASPRGSSVFLRKGRVKMDLAIASVAVRLGIEDGRCVEARVAAGAVAPVPLRLSGVESMLEGARLTEETLEHARDRACREISPITDLRSSEGYRRHLLGVLVTRAIRSLSAAGPNGGEVRR